MAKDTSEPEISSRSVEHFVQPRLDDFEFDLEPHRVAQPAITIRPAVSADAEQITNLMNIALMADDAFFTKPEDVNRVTVADTRAMMGEDGHSAVRFLVAEEAPGSTLVASPTLVGCVRVAMPTLVSAGEASEAGTSTPAFAAQLGMLAVPPGARGISTKLADAAEKLLKETAAETLEWARRRTWSLAPGKHTLRITVPVFSERADLLAFYMSRGYQTLRNADGQPESHPEFSQLASLIVKEEMANKVQLQILSKDIEVEA
jgi:hypothetical protein